MLQRQLKNEDGTFKEAIGVTEGFIFAIGAKKIADEHQELIETIFPPLSVFTKLTSSVLTVPTLVKHLLQIALFIEPKNAQEKADLKSLACIIAFI